MKCIVLVSICAVLCVDGFGEISKGYSRTPRFGIGIPVMSSSPETTGLTNINNITVTPTEAANQFLQNLPAIKLGILTSIVNFVAPLLQGILILSLIMFTVVGTASIVCHMIDCSNEVGLQNPHSQSYNGHGHSSGASLLLPISRFHHQHLHHLNQNPTLNPSQRKRQDIHQRKPWLAESDVSSQDLETLNKHNDK